MTQSHSVTHATFELTRSYDASLARVWKAFTSPEAKAQWFGAPSDKMEVLERYLEVRPGGRERFKVRFGGGLVSSFDATYYDVIENERMVYCYEMHMDERKISVSVATVQFKVEGNRTVITMTEQGAYLDGHDNSHARKHGTGELLDVLGRYLHE